MKKKETLREGRKDYALRMAEEHCHQKGMVEAAQNLHDCYGDLSKLTDEAYKAYQRELKILEEDVYAE